MKTSDIPTEVLNEISRRADEFWDNDLEMKEHMVDEEAKDYIELQHLSADHIPDDVLGTLKEKAANEHLDSFSDQRDYVVNGTNRYLYISELKQQSRPIREILIKMEAIISGECYNANVQNYGPGVFGRAKDGLSDIQLPLLRTVMTPRDTQCRWTLTKKYS
jgi:hypothetical protein